MSSWSYTQAGVNLDSATEIKALIKHLAAPTHNSQVLAGVGPFAGLFRLQGYSRPVLVASCDGVGTKLRVASLLNKYDTVGLDLVHHCVNDILCSGAEPLFFLDYIAMGRLSREKVVALVQGITFACQELGLPLLGGETAEMPGIYQGEDYDLVGFILGVVEEGKIIDGKNIGPGDVLLALPSTGLHTNGYSLMRKVFALEERPAILNREFPQLGRSLGEALLEPHRCYYPQLKPLLPYLKGIAHITGGGIMGNLPRVLPPGVVAHIDKGSWTIPPIFKLIQDQGAVSEAEMYRVFNMGIGMVLVCAGRDKKAVQSVLPESREIGRIEKGVEGEARVRINGLGLISFGERRAMRAIISVSNKEGVEVFARGLGELGVELYSTGGTQRSLEAAGVKVKSVSQLTGFPEILDGRVKTLHPAVHGGILARRDLAQHLAELSRQGIQPIDLVAVNLYPFKETVARGASWEEALENIDIGGPTLIRAAAKNFPFVLVVVDPKDYEEVLSGLKRGEISWEERKRLAYKAFQHVALYDTLIANYLRGDEGGWPEAWTVALRKGMELRYGENPHQRAAFYLEESPRAAQTLLQAKKLAGKELSYNNILDVEAALASVRPFSTPAVAVIKHNNPCGLACHADLAEAYRRALAGDPVAAFGGVVALNRPIDPVAAAEIDKTHFDIIIAPAFSPQAQALLGRKRDLILLALDPFPSPPPWEIKRAGGGFLLQSPDLIDEKEFQPKTMTRRQPNAEERRDLFFGWRVVKEIKSNAIALAKDETLLGMGAGQPSRVVSVELALKRAGDKAKGSVLASDAFFPFPDGVEMAAKAGITAIIQPGGSLRDEETIATANQYNVAMVFTGYRHFKH